MFLQKRLINISIILLIILSIIWGVKIFTSLKKGDNVTPVSVVINYNGEKLDYRNIKVFRISPNGKYFEFNKYTIDYW
ncbi:MAG TPA: hypothetical protein PK771_09495, partial [Spirochaetota bacterium]|nr:hypothetical protein [Spirochaetota bacterium]